jgi:hypothetical protein
MKAHRLYSAPVDRATGLICDQTIALDGVGTRHEYPEHLRRVRFWDPETAKNLVFLTNQTTLSALTICDLYKRRWQSLPPRRRGLSFSSSGSSSISGSSGSTEPRTTR